ncbi:MAG: hypothetical protein K2X90_02890 [Candidatus Babeliaceae bacterium]|nr:hypothetical protein [Candidatus Babeliaceae bacterium]
MKIISVVRLKLLIALCLFSITLTLQLQANIKIDDIPLIAAFRDKIYDYDIDQPSNNLKSCIIPIKGSEHFLINDKNIVYQIACRNQDNVAFAPLYMKRNGCGYFVLRNLDKLYAMLHADPQEYSELIRKFYNVNDHYEYFKIWMKVFEENSNFIPEKNDLDITKLMIIIEQTRNNFHSFITRDNISYVGQISYMFEYNNLSIRGNMLANLFKKINSSHSFYHGILLPVQLLSQHGADHYIGLLVYRDDKGITRYFILNSFNNKFSHENITNQIIDFIRKYIIDKNDLTSYYPLQDLVHDFIGDTKNFYFAAKYAKQ